MSESSQGLDRTERPWCSLITVTYNSRAALQEFWGAQQLIPDGVEWIVVDNCSTDGSAELARKLGATVVIERETNSGFSASNNVGLAAASGDFIGFVNPDIRVEYSDLRELQSVAISEKALVGPQLKNSDGSLQPNGRGFPLLVDKIRNRLGRQTALEGRYLLYAADNGNRKVCWLMGAAVFGERSVVEAISGWDSHFFLYYEDKDICLRAWNAGFPVVLTAAVQWTHGWARETTKVSATPWKRELASMAKFYRRYPEFLFGLSLAARKHRQMSREVFGSI
ncbi:glycosyltransferase family 2 protein [Cryobacterium zongtaii]|uniref:glycosyltransferase family 2 protein n=1 Tax=Cryobacterium zongtaii TaxID=1259217 RepID=UPI0013FDDAD4|nr:glycosyltransferase family 2 protein [Cryobacterium zongtaii]